MRTVSLGEVISEQNNFHILYKAHLVIGYCILVFKKFSLKVPWREKNLNHMFQFLRMTKVNLFGWGNETLLDLGMGVIGTQQTVVRGKTDVNNLRSSWLYSRVSD